MMANSSIYNSRPNLTNSTEKKSARQSMTKMSDREEQWFMADKRLIFACDDELIFKEWVTSLKELHKITQGTTHYIQDI